MAKDRNISRLFQRSRDAGGLKRAIANRRSHFSVDYSTLFTGTPTSSGPGGGGGGDVPGNALTLNGMVVQLNGQDLTLGA
jgi:hypothetical protein